MKKQGQIKNQNKVGMWLFLKFFGLSHKSLKEKRRSMIKNKGLLVGSWLTYKSKNLAKKKKEEGILNKLG